MVLLEKKKTCLTLSGTAQRKRRPPEWCNWAKPAVESSMRETPRAASRNDKGVADPELDKSPKNVGDYRY
jgi:hypothetical protein